MAALVFCLLVLLGVPLPVVSAGSVVEHLSPADRRAAVNDVFATFADQEPDIFRRRRLVKAGEKAPPAPAPDDPENLRVLIDHWQYQLQRSKHARLLRGFGFTDKDGLPRRIPGYDLAKDFHSASESLGLLLWHLENRTKERRVKKARRLKALNTVDRVRILEGAQRGEEFPRPKFLGIHPETGEYRFSLAGAYIGREEDRLPVVDNQGRRRLDLESFELPGLSNCKLSPVATYTKDVLIDDITESEQLHSGNVCKCITMHEAGDSIPGVGPVNQRWCECKISRRLTSTKRKLLLSRSGMPKGSDAHRRLPLGKLAKAVGKAASAGTKAVGNVADKGVDTVGNVVDTVAEAAGNGVRHYAMVANVCSSYPALGKATECKIDKSETAFPRKINCKFEFVLQRGMEFILETELRIGFGAAGHEDQLAADILIGLASRPFPRACWGDPEFKGLPSPSSPDFRCRALRFLSQTLDKVVDIGELLGGSTLKDSLELYPFKFQFPSTFEPKASSTKFIGGGDEMGRLKHMCRVPIQVPKLPSELEFGISQLSSIQRAAGGGRRRMPSADKSMDLLLRNSGAFDGMDIDDPNFNTITSKACLSNVGEALKRFGPMKNTFRYMSVGLGLSGCDFCVGTPNVTTEAGNTNEDIELGFNMKLSLFDPEKVDIMKLLDLIPVAWEEIAKLDPTGIVGEKGLKSLLQDAMNYKPFREVKFAGELVSLVNTLPKVNIDQDWNLRNHLNGMIKTLLPPKKIVTIDIGEIINNAVTRAITEAGGDANSISDFLKTAKSMLSNNPMTPNSFSFPKFLRADNAGRRARRAQRLRHLATAGSTEAPTVNTVKLEIPSGQRISVKVSGITRQLRDTDSKDTKLGIPSRKRFFNGVVTTKDGGGCNMTTGDVFPKTITCNLALEISAPKRTGSNPIAVNIIAQFQLAYSIDGKTLQLIVRQGYELEMPPLKVPDNFQPMINVLEKLDLGALIDRGFAGMISTVPPGLYFPSPTLHGEVRELARANLTTVKEEGVCVSNLHRIQPDVTSVEDSKSVLGILQAFASLMGGDLCGKVDKIDTSDGFKTNLMVKASLFDEDEVKVWPVINVLFDNMPQLAVIKNVVVAVLPKVAGMKNMDEVKGKLNELAKMVMPDKLTVDIDIGKMLADAYLNAELAAVKEFEAASYEEKQKDQQGTAGGRRLAAQRQLNKAQSQRRRLGYVLTDGLFDLGFIPPSDRYGEDSNGRGTPCGDSCKSGYVWGSSPSPIWNSTIEDMDSNRNRTIEDVDEEAENREFILRITAVSVSGIICIAAVVIYWVVKKRRGQGKNLPSTCFKCNREREGGTKKAGTARIVQVLPKRAQGTMQKSAKINSGQQRHRPDEESKKNQRVVSRPAPGQEKRRNLPKPPPAPPKINPTINKIEFKSSLAKIRRQFGADSAEYKAAVKNLNK